MHCQMRQVNASYCVNFLIYLEISLTIILVDKMFQFYQLGFGMHDDVIKISKVGEHTSSRGIF